MDIRVAPAPVWLSRVRQRAFRHAPEDMGAILLRHSRIYLLPTRRGLALIATLLTMLVTSLNYALSLGFVVTFLLAGLVGAALLHTFRNLAGLEIRPLSAGETFVGETIAFTLALAAHDRARFAVSLRAPGSEPVLMDVDANAQSTASLEMRARERGRVPLGRVTVSTVFPVGLWRAWAYVHFPLSGLAYPKPEIGAPPLPPPSATGGAAARKGASDDADLAGLREYQIGDPLQRVAWKAVARGGRWFTKQFEIPGGGADVFLDWNATPPHLDIEARLSRLCAWVLSAERSMRPYAVRLPELALPPGLGREQRRSALTALALFGSVHP